MPFIRTWDASCPQIYDEWEADGTKWVIQDLPPEDDEAALQLMMDDLLPDETLQKLSGVAEEEASRMVMSTFWERRLKDRTSLACYRIKDGEKTLAALNCCYVDCAGEKEEIPEDLEGEAFRNVYKTLLYIDSKFDPFKYLETDKYLYAVGLVVKREFRGSGLGARVLAAREPLCKSLGIPSTSTVFTGVASQKSALRAGFTEVLSLTLRELADAGLKYPRDDRCIKVMVKKYV